MLKTVIIEDDPFQMEIISDLLSGSFPSVKIISKAFNAKDGIEQISKGRPDLVFLDIDLPDRSGFEVLQELRGHFFDIIFVTAHEKFALNAYQYDAISFLIKPVKKEDISNALNKLNQKRRDQYSVQQVQGMIRELKDLYDNNQKIAVPTVKEINFIRVNEILRMEADGNYTTIYLSNGSPMLASIQLGEYEKQLSPDKFFRIHDKHLVNLRFVKTLTKGESSTVIMEDNSQLPLSRRRKEDFMKAVGKLFS